MSSWSQKRLEGGSFPSPAGVPRRAPLYGGGGGGMSLTALQHGLSPAPQPLGMRIRGAPALPTPHPLHPPCLRAASGLATGSGSGGRDRAGAGAWGSPRAGRWEAWGSKAWGASALECKLKSLERLREQALEGICLRPRKTSQDGHWAGQPYVALGR